MTQTTARDTKFALWKSDRGTIPMGALPFCLIQLSILTAFTTYLSWTGLALCAASYLVRMFAITAFYHRYFSHRTFKLGRVMQFVAALLGATASQKGALWWAAHHRKHHKHSDTPSDPHSSEEGFWHTHFLWFLYTESAETDYDVIKDLARYKELLWLERHWHLAPILLGFGLFLVGGWHFVVWGFFVPTVLVMHVTYCINSVTHVIGRQYFSTGDESRNHWFLGLLALGEGWHNNHHRYQASTRNGFYWYEFDITYYILKAMVWMRLAHSLTPVPFKILEEGRINRSMLRESKRLGGDIKPITVLRSEIQELSDQFAARARVLRVEIQAMSEQVGEKAGTLRAEMQTLSDQVVDKVGLLRSEARELGAQVAEKRRHLHAELKHLQDMVARRGRQLGAERQNLNELVAAKARMLAREIQELGEEVAARGKHAKLDMQELSDFMTTTGSHLKSELQELGEQASQRGRALRREMDELGGLLPAVA